MLPFIARAQVISQTPPDSVMVLYPSGQMPGIPVKVLTQGPADALRVKQEALPTPGTWGIVAFPGGNLRNGVWLGSYYAQNTKAFTSVDDPHFEYNSHWSGFYQTLDKSGQQTTYYPDGTAIVVGTATSPDPTFRQIVNADQSSGSVEFTPSERVPSAPSPFNYTVLHPSGAQVQIEANGAVNITVATGQTLNINLNGQSVTDALVLVSKFISEFNAHTHSDPQGGNTGVPNTPLTAADVESTLVKISN